MLVLTFVCLFALAVGDDWATPLEKSAKISSEELSQLGKDIVTKSVVAQESTAGVEQLLSQEGQLRSTCPHCSRKDYSDSCPLGWTQFEDGSCGASSAYKGLCNKTQTFALSSVSDKKEIEIECDVCWPCSASEQEASTCKRNWNLPCPNGYSPQDISYERFSEAAGITCAPDYSYEGQCEPQVIFNDLQSKYDFAVRCKTSWPCENNCMSFSQCPADWESLGGGFCMAPPSYKVKDCPLFEKFQGWTSEVKQTFAQRCGVEWACLTEAGQLDMACELDLSSCPRGWIEKGGVCKSMVDASGPCANAVNARAMSIEQKLDWASKCGLEWPCVGESNEYNSGEQPREGAEVETSAGGPLDNSGQIVIQ